MTDSERYNYYPDLKISKINISSLNKYKYFILLLIIIFLVIANNFIWIKNNKISPIGNGLQDLLPGINFYLDIVHSKITFKDLLKDIFRPLFFTRTFPPDYNNYIRFQFFIYPPLPPLSYAFFYFMFGPIAKLELMANVLYLAIAMISIYGIGKKIFNEKAGVLAAFILSSFPGVIAFSRQIYAEFILMCMVCLMLLFLLKTDFFRSRKYSVILGVSLGLTALTKWEFMPIMVGPFFWYVSQSHIFVKNEVKAAVSTIYIRINFILSILIGLIISSFWYSISINDIIRRLFYSPDNILRERYTHISLSSLLIQKFSFYILAIINTFIGIFYFLLLVLTGIVFLCKVIKYRNRESEIKNYRSHASFLILWIAIPYLFLSIVNLQTASHILLVLPAIALIISLGIFSFKNIILRSALIFLIVLYGIGSYLHSFIDFRKLDADVLYKLKIYLNPSLKLTLTTRTDNIPRDDYGRKYFYPPATHDLKIKEIISFIKEDSRFMGFRPVVLILSHKEEFNSFTFQYYNLLNDYQLFIEPRGNDRSPSPPDPSKFDYVVVNPFNYKTIDEKALLETIKLTLNIEEVHKIDKLKKTFFNRYKLIKAYLLPDNTTVKIYKVTSG